MVDIPEILIVYSVVDFKQISVAAACMLDARWGIMHVMYVYCFVYLYLSLLFNLKLVDLCERGNYGGLCGVLTIGYR